MKIVDNENTLHPRIPQLDGFRAVAILMVILGHMHGSSNFSGVLEPIKGFGNLGVRIFFVISGYIITNLLLQEMSRTNTISIRDFYLRRAFRIFPALCVFICAMFAAGILKIVPVDWYDFARGIGFFMNYHHDLTRNWTLNHLWSLSAEEQFYLTWPLILLIISARFLPWGVLGIILVTVFVRIVMAEYFSVSDSALNREIQAIYDSMATGGFLSILTSKLTPWSSFPKKLESYYAFFIGVFLSLIGLAVFFFSQKLFYIYSQSIVNVGIAVVLGHLIFGTRSLFSRALSFKPLVWIGTISYSLYLWQQFFLHHGSTHWLVSFPQNLPFLFLFATLSYYLVEKPFIRRGRQLLASRSSTHPPAL